jgi:hypothetical protein
VTTAFKNTSAIYLDFAQAFESFDRPKLADFVKKHQDTFQRVRRTLAFCDNVGRIAQDGNYGLLLQCLNRLRHEAILRLRRIYITATLQDVAQAIETSGPIKPEHLQAAEQDIHTLVRESPLSEFR